MLLKNYKIINKYFFAIIIVALLIPAQKTDAESIEELEQRISEQRNKIEKLDKEIAEQRSKLQAVNKEANTLQNAVKTLQITEEKILNDIKKTENNIGKSEFALEKLTLEITDKERKIIRNKELISETLKQIDELESRSLLETILIEENFSIFFNTIYSMNKFKDNLYSQVLSLKDLNEELQEDHKETEEEKEELESFKTELSGEKEAVEYTRKEKESLLVATRNKEAEYQRILEQKLAQRKEFEAAMLEFESQLQTLIDPTSYPNPNRGILAWPVDSIIITQQFGGTQFAKSNPGVYGRPFHNGTDFGVPIGTKVKSALSGTVVATGNTDAFSGCYSWGKWVLVKHNNGLTTLYAHLSSILVSSGQTVETGETIALSGNTGYSTGPHLHFTLYASQGVEVVRFNEFKPGSTGCSATGASTPVAPLDAYLDPMSYLPTL